jgi:hypothetical protein
MGEGSNEDQSQSWSVYLESEFMPQFHTERPNSPPADVIDAVNTILRMRDFVAATAAS